MTRYGSFKRLVMIAGVVATAAGWGALVVTHAQTASKTTTATQKPKMRGTTEAQRKAAAAARKAATDTTTRQKPSPTATTGAASMTTLATADALAAASAAALVVGQDGTLVPDYFGNVPNYATSPLLQKFVDPLPSIPIAVPDACSYPDPLHGNVQQPADCYEIHLREYSQKFHSSLPATKLRGYVQVKGGVDVAPITYLGPIIVAQSGKPVRVTFVNELPAGTAGNLFIPTDASYMGAGNGPTGQPYSQNRATLHLHGGTTPWISDGTPHQWTTPAAEATAYPKGVSVKNVPDMGVADNAPGKLTFFYSNQQSARLMFYHDHAYGITRLNVYAGEAAGYLLTDATEQALIGAGGPLNAVGLGTPLVIQDKTFVPDNTTPITNLAGTFPSQLAAQDPTWDSAKWGGFGQLWYPHVYMPNQNPYDLSGANPMGRWDYGPWFWPPFTGLQFGPVANPYFATTTFEPPFIPGVPSVSGVPEAFMDTPIVNGVAYPSYSVPAGLVRFRILNAANDRFLNLSLFVAADKTGGTTSLDTAARRLCMDGSVPVSNCTEVSMVPFNQTKNASQAGGFFPAWWYDGTVPNPFDDRMGGVPDPTTRGPAMIQIGTEGGFLPAPATIRNQPVNYVMNKRDITVGNVREHALFLAPAERADVVVDFTPFAGQTLILYNDAPAPVPAADPRLDYFTGAPDLSDTGGSSGTLPGFGPNIRTVMQIHVNGGGGIGGVDYVNTALLGQLTTAIPAAFAASQDTIIVPQAPYNAAYHPATPFPGDVTAYVRIQDTTHSFTPIGATAPVLADLQPKSIIEDFQIDYGRMNALLGVEIPRTNMTNQTSIPQGYIDPPTELLAFSDAGLVKVSTAGTLADGTQLWKITHNGVDTHAMHFHMFNVQIINRVGWDGAIRPPDANELGWKDTIRTNPLEDIIVAIRPIRLTNLPFKLPNSVRPLDVTQPVGSLTGFTNVDPNGNPVTVSNQLVNFGWEYVWHCHLLGHEENDMMRGMIMAVSPEKPSGLTAAFTGTPANKSVRLNWIDNSLNATEFTVQKATDAAFTNIVNTIPVGKVVTYVDPVSTVFYYRVFASNTVGLSLGTYPTMTAPSDLSNVAFPSNPVNTVSPTSLAFGSQLVGTTSAPRTVTVTNTGTGTLNLTGIALGGTNPSQYAIAGGTCPTGASTLAAGGSCTISVTLKPTSAGSKPATLNVNAAFPAASVAVTLSGTGGSPIAIDQAQSTDSTSNSDRIAVNFRTTQANEVVLAFVSADANPPPAANTTVTSVSNSGGGVTWTLVRRANAQLGTAEVWRAIMPTARTGTVTAFLNQFVPARSITVVSFLNATGTGASGSFSAASGGPTGTIATQTANSWVWGVGTDWASATARTVPANQTMVHQYLSANGDTYWVQRQNALTPTAGTSVTINDTAPTADRYNLVVVEIR